MARSKYPRAGNKRFITTAPTPSKSPLIQPRKRARFGSVETISSAHDAEATAENPTMDVDDYDFLPLNEVKDEGEQNVKLENGPFIDIQTVPDVVRAVQIHISDLTPTMRESLAILPFFTHWHNECRKLQEQKVFKPMTIAFVGGSGEGKTTLLQAVLGETTTFLPRGGHGFACTSAITEIGYSDDGDKYVGTVKFLSKEEWRRELDLCLKDLRDEDGNMPSGQELHAPRGPRAKALKAVQAVFPHLRPEEYSMELFETQEHVETVLGTTKIIESDDIDDFHDLLLPYVGQQGGEIQWWPVVSKIVVKHKWPILSSGIVLVDLPGGGDANPARAAIADDYIQRADKVFVVADVKRAVNQKLADDYLTNAFGRQLKMGGRSDSITLICSRIDEFPRHDLKDEIRRYDLKAEYQEMISEAENAVNQMQLTEVGKKSELKAARKEVDNKMIFKCIQLRNERVKAAKQEGFVALLKEGLPEELQTSYEGFELPMHFVSPITFLSLQAEEGPGEIFPDEASTGIPELRRYIHKLGLDEQKRVTKAFGEAAVARLTMISNHLSQRNTGPLDSEVVRVLQEICQKHLEQMKEKWKSLVDDSMASSRTFLQQIFADLETGAEEGRRVAPITVRKWHKHPMNGGLHHMVYMAMYRRNGRYKQNDFNNDLVNPTYNAVQAAWIVFFNDIEAHIKQIFDEMETMCKQVLDEAIKELLDVAPIQDMILKDMFSELEMWRHQKDDRLSEFDSSRTRLHDQIRKEMQKGMDPGYHDLNEVEFKIGYFKIVKRLMEDYVRSHEAMHQAVATEMATHLDTFLQEMSDSLIESWNGLGKNLETQCERFWEHVPLEGKALVKWEELRVVARRSKLKVEEVMRSELLERENDFEFV